MDRLTFLVLVVAAITSNTDAAVTFESGQQTRTVAINEGAAAFDPPLTVTARTDVDVATLTYAFKTAQAPFTIDKAGTITISEPLDFEATATYTLTITVSEVNASDSPTVQTAEATVTVKVKDVPTFAKTEDNACVQDGATQGAEVATLDIKDKWTTGTATYTIAGAGNDKFAVKGGKIVVDTGKHINKADGNSYTLAIKQTSAEGTLTLTVTVGDCSAASLLAPFSLLTLLMALLATVN